LTIYLVDEPFAELAFAYAATDASAKLVLLQDAIYLARRGGVKGEVYVIGDDATRRGLDGSFPAGVHKISYPDLVAMMEAEKVVNFL
jgi:sulfur relay protein TusB/DsrH